MFDVKTILGPYKLIKKFIFVYIFIFIIII